MFPRTSVWNLLYKYTNNVEKTCTGNEIDLNIIDFDMT